MSADQVSTVIVLGLTYLSRSEDTAVYPALDYKRMQSPL